MREDDIIGEQTHMVEEFDTRTLRNGEVANVRLTAADRSILSAMEPVVDAIATLFGEHCEVLIHSLEDLSHSVIKISNSGVTGRQIGSPMTDLGIKVLKNAEHTESDVIGSYYGKTNDGKTLKSVTALIRNGTKPIGILCINLSLSAPLMDILRHFLPDTTMDGRNGESPEHFVMSTEELVRRSLDTAIAEIGAKREISHQVKNKLIVSELHDQGIFDVKGAVDIVAKELGVSRYTIYNYIREVRV
jgi:predicted transcriptional regulator YheO